MPEGDAHIYTGGSKTLPKGRHVLEVGVSFVKLSSTAVTPKYATELAAGMDLCADHDAGIPPGTSKLILTNIAIKLPRFFEAQIRSRSGLAAKRNVFVLNSPGTIDADYRGGIGVVLYNAGDLHFAVKQGDRIAQMVFAPMWRGTLYEVDLLDESVRGAGGFGSTGIK